MIVKKSELAEMIREAVLRRVRDLHEFSGADPDPVEKGDEELKSQKRKLQPSPDAPPPEQQGPDDAEAPEPEQDPESQQQADQDKADAIDAQGNAGRQTGQINRQIAGKSVQSITVEDDSKILAGDKEVLISFEQGAKPLRILVSPTGQVSFFWNGQLHDIP